jgi:hypothetical protein
LKGARSEPMLPEAGEIEGQMRAALSLPYLRAIAKIGFHFVLAHFPFTGLEAQFDDIKRFIFTGKDYGRFIQPLQEPFVEELKVPEMLVKDWCHLLSAQYDYNTVEARMQFFVGPKLRPIVWRLMLGPSPSRVVGIFNKGFLYRYFEVPDENGYAGEMTALQPALPSMSSLLQSKWQRTITFFPVRHCSPPLGGAHTSILSGPLLGGPGPHHQVNTAAAFFDAILQKRPTAPVCLNREPRRLLNY